MSHENVDPVLLEMCKGKSPWNPSKTATNRVLNKLPPPTFCRNCSSHVRVKSHLEIYGRVYGEWPWMYACTGCDSYVGMHPFTDIPLGFVANKELRDARTLCKKSFEKLYKDQWMTRTEAYLWLSEKLGIEHAKCHFGWFGLDRCFEAKIVCDEFIASNCKHVTH